MTNKEAKEWMIAIAQKYIHGGDSGYDAKRLEAIDSAIEALEKQIPKKPKDYDSVPHNRCPNCNSAIRVYCDDMYDPVCKFCGQAIDWSDLE